MTVKWVEKLTPFQRQTAWLIILDVSGSVLFLLTESAAVCFTYQQLSFIQNQCVQIAELSSVFIVSPSANGCHGNAFPDHGLYRLTVHWPSKLKWQSHEGGTGEWTTTAIPSKKKKKSVVVSVKFREKPQKLMAICKALTYGFVILKMAVKYERNKGWQG